jgi:hypothetical protein
MINKKVLFAGIFALAATGAGVWYAATREAPEPIMADPVPVVTELPFIGPRTKSQAMKALADLPELKAWSAHLEKSSGGTVHGALIEYGPTPKVIGDKSYWQFSYVENTPEAARRWESFLVGENNPDILVEDDESGIPMPLDQWRKEKQPLTRTSAL